MNMSLDRLFFFWRKGDSLLIEKREQDLFERMKNCIGCTYISDLPRYRYEVWEKMKRISLDQYTLKQLDDFCEYVFGIRYWMVKQMQEREGTFEKSECKYAGYFIQKIADSLFSIVNSFLALIWVPVVLERRMCL